VVVKLNSGVDYRGILACLDGFMNIAMEQTEEYVDGQLKARYGDCFIRGNNGKFLVRIIVQCGCLPVLYGAHSHFVLSCCLVVLYISAAKTKK
jgi:U6 snRNA-associated Sm-like protein LSm6